MKRHKIFLAIFFTLSMIGFILTSLEFFYALQGKSLCPTEGCAAVGSFAKDDKVLYFTGMVFFGLLIMLILVKRFPLSVGILIDILLILALAVEGYLVGFQVFVVQNYCQFCLTIAGIIVLLALTKIILKKNIILSVGFIAFFLMFASVWFINPGLKTLPQSQYVLIYSDNCPHCHKVVEFCKEKNIPVELVKVEEVKGFCKTANLDTVPVLVCNYPDKKTILKGEANIINYFSDLFSPTNTFAKEDTKKAVKNTINNKQSKSSEEIANNQDAGFCPIFKQSEPCGEPAK